MIPPSIWKTFPPKAHYVNSNYNPLVLNGLNWFLLSFWDRLQEDSQYTFLGKRHLSMDYSNDYCNLRNYDASW